VGSAVFRGTESVTGGQWPLRVCCSYNDPLSPHIESRPFSPPTSAGHGPEAVNGLREVMGCRNGVGMSALEEESETSQVTRSCDVSRISHDRINNRAPSKATEPTSSTHSQRNAEALNCTRPHMVTCYRGGCRDISTSKVPKINSRAVQTIYLIHYM
jgi:hypothetical protein